MLRCRSCNHFYYTDEIEPNTNYCGVCVIPNGTHCVKDKDGKDISADEDAFVSQEDIENIDIDNVDNMNEIIDILENEEQLNNNTCVYNLVRFLHCLYVLCKYSALITVVSMDIHHNHAGWLYVFCVPPFILLAMKELLGRKDYTFFFIGLPLVKYNTENKDIDVLLCRNICKEYIPLFSIYIELFTVITLIANFLIIYVINDIDTSIFRKRDFVKEGVVSIYSFLLIMTFVICLTAIYGIIKGSLFLVKRCRRKNIIHNRNIQSISYSDNAIL